MTNNFTDVMKSRTNEDLVEIVTLHRHQYLHEAILAAEEELTSRNLNLEDIKKRNHEYAMPPAIRMAFNKKYLLSGLILLFPILLLIFSFYKEDLGGFFLLPLIIIVFAFCGAMTVTMAKQENKKIPERDTSINFLIGHLQIIFGVLMTIVGIIGITWLIAFAMAFN